jgi:O-acetyl-ADP-ribose deacetylase (regulator of RNase III)
VVLRLEKGDITEQAVDAIVNAANSSLAGGGGVDGAIHRRGGSRILQECRRIRAEQYPEGLPPGEAVATTGGDLQAKWVIHTVGPVYGMNHHADLLAACHTNSLALADSIGASSVAFPAISTGVYGYPLDQAAKIAIRTVRLADTRVKEIRFVLYTKEALEAFEAAARYYSS